MNQKIKKSYSFLAAMKSVLLASGDDAVKILKYARRLNKSPLRLYFQEIEDKNRDSIFLNHYLNKGVMTWTE